MNESRQLVTLRYSEGSRVVRARGILRSTSESEFEKKVAVGVRVLLARVANPCHGSRRPWHGFLTRACDGRNPRRYLFLNVLAQDDPGRGLSRVVGTADYERNHLPRQNV